MTTENTEIVEQDLQELTTTEIDEVAGGFLPLAIMAFSVGFSGGFIGMCAFGPTGFKG